MRKILFIITSIISVLVEYLIIYLLFNYIFGFHKVVTYGMLISILVVMTFLTITSYVYLHKETPSDEEKPNEVFLTKIIEQVNSKYHKHFKLYYITTIQPNPAWCIGNCIYVNNNYRIDEDYLGGIIGHELGHALSGICNYTFLASLKPSTVISKVIYFTIIALTKKQSSINKIFLTLFIGIYILFSLNNLIFIYPMIRNDEYVANKLAVELGYGQELRCYYGLGYDEDLNPLIQKLDFLHPSLSQMINKINQELNLTKDQLEYYVIKNKLIKCTKMTKTITLPEQIEIITNKAFINPHLKKITSYNVLSIQSGAFSNNLELEELIFPNLVSLGTYKLNKLTKLKNIKINNEVIITSLIEIFKDSNPNLSKKLTFKIRKE